MSGDSGFPERFYPSMKEIRHSGKSSDTMAGSGVRHVQCNKWRLFCIAVRLAWAGNVGVKSRFMPVAICCMDAVQAKGGYVSIRRWSRGYSGCL